jgi:predicted nucleic acid-binding protein
VSKKYSLDFDDAYQYALAKKYNLEIVSFNSDFDRTDAGRALPEQVIDGSI